MICNYIILLEDLFFNLHITIRWSIFAVFFVVSITGIKIIDRIAKILIKDRPVAIDKIVTLLISNEYLHIFNLLYFLDSSFNCNNISLNSFSKFVIYF